MTIKCDNCNSSETYIKDYEHEYEIRGKKIKFKAKRRFCKKCNNLVYDQELDNEVGRIAIDLYNKEYGISKERIINLRKNYNLSQALFAKIIGCAKKTLISYEKGIAIPNDNYVIIINSLIARPSTIETLIEANKSKFTEKEYSKINTSIANFLSNEITNEEFIPTEYNGYTKFSFEKIVNMILFFANKGVTKTKLFKEMFYADFLNYKKTGASITGLEYAKITYGPVPENKDAIIDECLIKEYIVEDVEYKNDYIQYTISSNKKINNNIFNEDELETLNLVKNFFKDFKAKQIADFSHEEEAYIKTDFSKHISYDYAFDINSINN